MDLNQIKVWLYDTLLILGMFFGIVILGSGALFIPILGFKYLTKAIC